MSVKIGKSYENRQKYNQYKAARLTVKREEKKHRWQMSLFGGTP